MLGSLDAPAACFAAAAAAGITWCSPVGCCCLDGAGLSCTPPMAHCGPPACCLQVREAARRSVLTEAGISDLAAAGGKNMVRTSAVAACCYCSIARGWLAPRLTWCLRSGVVGWTLMWRPSHLRSLFCRSSCGLRALRTRSSRRPTRRWRSGGRRRTRVGGGRAIAVVHQPRWAARLVLVGAARCMCKQPAWSCRSAASGTHPKSALCPCGLQWRRPWCRWSATT